MRTGFSAQGKSGEKLRARLTFATNDPKRPEVTIEFVAQLQGAVVAVPADISLGELQLGSVVTHKLQIRDTGRNAPFRLAAVRSDNPKVVSVVKTTHAPGGDDGRGGSVQGVASTHTVELKVTAPATPGLVHARLLVTEEGNPTPILTVPVSGRVVPRYRLAPESLVLPRRGATGLLYSATCLCSSTSGKPFVLTLTRAPAGITAAVTKQSDSRYLVEVTADPALVPADGKVLALAFQADEPLSLPVRVVTPE